VAWCVGSQAGLTYRAIKLNIRAFNWERALALAQQHGCHIDTVVMHRQRYLAAAGAGEALPALAAAAQAWPVDAQAIKQRVQADKAAEAARCRA